MDQRPDTPAPSSAVVYALVTEAGIAAVLNWSSSWDALAKMERDRGRLEHADLAADRGQWFHEIAMRATATLKTLDPNALGQKADPPANAEERYRADILALYRNVRVARIWLGTRTADMQPTTTTLNLSVLARQVQGAGARALSDAEAADVLRYALDARSELAWLRERCTELETILDRFASFQEHE